MAARVGRSVLNEAAINVSAGLYLDQFGTVHPVTNWIDAEGDECATSEAVAFVAGSGGTWFSEVLADFTEAQR